MPKAFDEHLYTVFLLKFVHEDVCKFFVSFIPILIYLSVYGKFLLKKAFKLLFCDIYHNHFALLLAPCLIQNLEEINVAPIAVVTEERELHVFLLFERNIFGFPE